MEQDKEANSLEQFNLYTVVSADTGDVNLIKTLKPKDATTNPTLILKSVDTYKEFLDEAVEYSTKKLNSIDPENKDLLDLIFMKTCVNFGKAILEHIEGVVSTEVDARVSFDKEGSLKRARTMISLYEEMGIPKERILVKLSSNWEGVEAAEILEKEGIKCNLTLVFSLVQAVACAERGITLISPFVGRVNDAFSKKTGQQYEFKDEPGVNLVKNIFNYYKKFGYKTIIMGASLRSTGSCYELAGCDKLTIPPNLIDAMRNEKVKVNKKLDLEEALKSEISKIDSNESAFKNALDSDEIASTLLKNGIDAFVSDSIKLENIIKEKLLALK